MNNPYDASRRPTPRSVTRSELNALARRVVELEKQVKELVNAKS